MNYASLCLINSPSVAVRVAAGLLSLALPLLAIRAQADGTNLPPLHICLISGSVEYESDKSLSDFEAFLKSNYHVTCHRASGKDKGQGLPGLEALDGSDLAVVFARRVTLTTNELSRLKQFVARGGPILGIRTASHAFQNWPEFDREVLGGNYSGHSADKIVQVQIISGRLGHPLLAGVTPFESRKLYQNPRLAEDTVVLLEGVVGDEREPVAWARDRNGARVFYTSLGTQADFQTKSFRQLLVNAVFWTTRRDPSTCRLPSNPSSQ
jgi:type 1 glutamine amidotransferase